RKGKSDSVREIQQSRCGGWSWYADDAQSPDPLARMHTMTKRQAKSGTIDVKALLAADEEFLRVLVRTALQEVLEAEMVEALGAEKSERTAGRQGYRSGYYGRTLITRVGKLELRVPQDRAGRFSTELFERYQRSERALVAGAGGNVRAGSVDAEGKGGLGAVPRLGGLYLARRDQGRHRAG